MAWLGPIRNLAEILWAMVPGFNVYAYTAKGDFGSASDSTYSWQLIRHLTNGPYALDFLSFKNTQSSQRYGGCNVRVTADGNEFSFSQQTDNTKPPEENDPEDTNFLPFPIIAKSELKLEMRKRGSYSTNACRVTATWQRIVTQ